MVPLVGLQSVHVNVDFLVHTHFSQSVFFRNEFNTFNNTKTLILYFIYLFYKIMTCLDFEIALFGAKNAIFC